MRCGERSAGHESLWSLLPIVVFTVMHYELWFIRCSERSAGHESSWSLFSIVVFTVIHSELSVLVPLLASTIYKAGLIADEGLSNC